MDVARKISPYKLSMKARSKHKWLHAPLECRERALWRGTWNFLNLGVCSELFLLGPTHVFPSLPSASTHRIKRQKDPNANQRSSSFLNSSVLLVDRLTIIPAIKTINQTHHVCCTTHECRHDDIWRIGPMSLLLCCLPHWILGKRIERRQDLWTQHSYVHRWIQGGPNWRFDSHPSRNLRWLFMSAWAWR